MPGSIRVLDDHLKQRLQYINIRQPINSVLDVGAGDGAYSWFLRENCPQAQLHAVEPTDTYIKDYELNDKYDKVFPVTIQEFLESDTPHIYDVARCGDVLEHLFLSEAIDTIECLLYCARRVIVMWPTNASQGWWEGNKYEKHKSNFTLSDLSRFNVVSYLKVPIEGTGNYHYAEICGMHSGVN